MALKDLFGRLFGSGRDRRPQRRGPTTPVAGPQRADDELTVYAPERPDSVAGDERPVMARLEAVEGELKGEVFLLREGENQLGRAPDSDVVLDSPFVSRAHARVICSQDQMVLVAVGDKPTRINGELCDRQDLNAGDTIEIGQTTLRVHAAN